MMRFDVITIFPRLVDAFAKESLLKRAQKKKLLKITAYNLRTWAAGKHKTADDKPFGGGLGMVMKVEPIFKAVQALKKSPASLKLRRTSKVILFTPRGKKFTQKMAYEFSKLGQIVFICGRYEGIDERVAKHIADEEISIGEYVTMGGEVAAMAVMEAVARLIPGVVGKPEFLRQRSVVKSHGFVEYPQYTRPEVFQAPPSPRLRRAQWKVPKVLLSGDHKKIGDWKAKHGRVIGK